MTTLKGALVGRPGDTSTLSAAMRAVQRAIEMDLEVCIPARVVSYDRANNVAEVRPQIMLTKRDPAGGDYQRIQRTVIPEIPVLSLGAGNFHINFPLKPGDLGWLYACDRDITLFLQTLEEQHAATDGASHRFTDAVFIPDVVRNYTIAGEDAGAMVIQSTDSATRISLRADNIKLTTPVKVTLDTPLVETTQNLTVGGDLTVNGNAAVSGPNATLPAGTTVNGKPVDGHDHGGVVPPF